MRVIRRGRTQAPRATWQCKNRNCEAVIESAEDEGQLKIDPRDGDAIVFACPECGEANWIDRRKFRR